MIPADESRIPPHPRLGVQLYSARDLLQTDFAGTLAALAAFGYAEVELAGLFDHRARDVRRMLDDRGLRAVGMHIDSDAVAARLPQTLDDAATLGAAFVVCAWIPAHARQDGDAWRRVADLLNQAGETCRSAGIQCAYHQHAFEFAPLDPGGGVIYDCLLERTDAELVKMELDVAWAMAAGVDPAEYLIRHPLRFPLIHVKDWVRGVDQSDRWSHAFAPNAPTAGTIANVGSGSIDWASVLRHAEAAGVQHYIVEHDEPPSPLEDLGASLMYLRRLLV